MRSDACWLGISSAHGPLTTPARHRHRHRRHKRGGRSTVPLTNSNPNLALSFSCSYSEAQNAEAQGQNDCRRREWYSSEGRTPTPETARRWVQSDDLSSLSSFNQPQDKFALLSYNILGVNNASYHRDLYVNVPFDALRWDSRKHLICQEIRRSNADIVCLQEVDRYNDILTNVKKEGYSGSYKRRTGDAKDGCAILWKEERLHLLEGDSLEFTSFGLHDNVAQLFVFELHGVCSRRVVIGNIHVLFNPKRGDIKLGQVRMLASKAYALSEKWGGIPIVLTGDFNTTPESSIYKFLSTSELNLNGFDRRDVSGQERLQSSTYVFPRLPQYCWNSEELKNATGDAKCTKLTHPLNLRSSYASVKGNARTRGPYGEPLVTSYHSKFLGTVDYLWYSTGLVPIRVLDTLPVDSLKSLGGLPSKNIGSDHLPLAAEFVFTKCREPQELDPTSNVENEEKEDCHTR